MMKLLITIVQNDDVAALTEAIVKSGHSATKLSSSGGILRSGNTTLLIGVDDEKMHTVMSIIEDVCKSRKQMTSAPSTMGSMGGMPGSAASYPVEVTVGGATVFVLSVDQFIKL